MTVLETSQHLFQPTQYRTVEGGWHRTFANAVEGSDGSLRYNPAAFLSMLSFGFVCGDETLFQEIVRQPWMSGINASGDVELSGIPPHGLLWRKPQEIARELHRRLLDEAARACEGRSEIYVLLSGGLDSRIVAGILAELRREDRLAAKPIAVTWGHEHSRDVVYAREIAESLDFEWHHVDLGPQHLMENVSIAADQLGAMASPVHLHRMPWFSHVSPEALVLAGSYGDSVGRAEFSGKTVLELGYLMPADPMGLLTPSAASTGSLRLDVVRQDLRNRCGPNPKYVVCEHEQQCHYMRSSLAHVMSVINNHATVYQLFTDPSVYGYMWSIHPSLRTDLIYATLLDQLGSGLSRRPWARSNRALRGKTIGARQDLRPQYADYQKWISGPLYDELRGRVDPTWFAETGLFDREAIRRLGDDIRRDSPRLRLYGNQSRQVWIWLAAVRELAETMKESGHAPRAADSQADSPCNASRVRPVNSVSNFRRLLRSNQTLLSFTRKCRRRVLRQLAKKRFPPQCD